jgi:hypothetical protein
MMGAVEPELSLPASRLGGVYYSTARTRGRRDDIGGGGGAGASQREMAPCNATAWFYLGVIAFFALVHFLLNPDPFVAPISTSSESHRYFDLNTITLRASVETFPTGAPPNSHNSTMNDVYDEICIAAVDDGMITASAVVDVTSSGYMELALPYSYETNASTECIHFNKLMGHEEITRVFHSKIRRSKQLDACDIKVFQPGYYDHSTGFWHDTCTSSQPIRQLPTTEESCPMLSRIENDVWVSIIGDSVTRQFLYYHTSDKEVRSWTIGRTSGTDCFLFAIGGQKSRKIWLLYTFDFIIEGGESSPDWHGHMEKPLTWGDFIRLRGAGPRDDDPLFSFDKMPDIVFYSGGYHASTLTSSQYGAAVEEVVIQYHDASKAYNVPMPQFHLLLNIMVSSFINI